MRTGKSVRESERVGECTERMRTHVYHGNDSRLFLRHANVTAYITLL